MIYQVRANLFFNQVDDANDFIDNCLDAMHRAVIVHPDEPNQQGCSVELIKCFHDETPTRPCKCIGEIHCP